MYSEELENSQLRRSQRLLRKRSKSPAGCWNSENLFDGCDSQNVYDSIPLNQMDAHYENKSNEGGTDSTPDFTHFLTCKNDENNADATKTVERNSTLAFTIETEIDAQPLDLSASKSKNNQICKQSQENIQMDSIKFVEQSKMPTKCKKSCVQLVPPLNSSPPVAGSNYVAAKAHCSKESLAQQKVQKPKAQRGRKKRITKRELADQSFDTSLGSVTLRMQELSTNSSKRAKRNRTAQSTTLDDYVIPKVTRYYDTCPVMQRPDTKFFYDTVPIEHSQLPAIYPPHFNEQIIVATNNLPPIGRCPNKPFVATSSMPPITVATNEMQLCSTRLNEQLIVAANNASNMQMYVNPLAATSTKPPIDCLLTPENSHSFDAANEKEQNAPSTPTLSENSVEDFLAYDDLLKTLSSERTIYRLTDNHIRALAIALDVNVELLHSHLDRITKLDAKALHELNERSSPSNPSDNCEDKPHRATTAAAGTASAVTK